MIDLLKSIMEALVQRKLNQNKVSVLSLFHSDRIILLVVDADDERGNRDG